MTLVYMGKPRNKNYTQKYPIVFFDTPSRPATRYFFQYPTRPDIEKPYPLGTAFNKAENWILLIPFLPSYKGKTKAFLDALESTMTI